VDPGKTRPDDRYDQFRVVSIFSEILPSPIELFLFKFDNFIIYGFDF
jgi:hypothetical protein